MGSGMNDVEDAVGNLATRPGWQRTSLLCCWQMRLDHVLFLISHIPLEAPGGVAVALTGG
jgi:hypothetical protein